ncbi:uncharacterized protein [Haliotis asinina]|uniref:uncharacterized protein n=1 Tax=Haliotis asinina TaxID=109174 RepID=UPI0035323677
MSEPDSTFLSVEPTTSSTPPPQNGRCCRGVLYVLIAVSLTANVVLIVVVAARQFLKPREHHLGTEGLPTLSNRKQGIADHICLTCDQLGPLVESKDTLYDVIRLSSGHALCCQRQKNDITTLFQKIISDEYYRRTTGRDPEELIKGVREKTWNIPMESTWAHRYLVPHIDSLPTWTTSDPYNTSFCFNVECDGKKVIVAEQGMYLVYSHITFISLPTPSDTPFLHMIQRKNPNLPGLGETPILMSKTSFPWTVAPQQTSFLSAIVKLRKQDRLHVEVSNNYYDLVEKGRFSNYFGVMKM